MSTITPFKKKHKNYRNRMYAFDYINYAILIICALIAAYPIFYVFIGSLSNGDAYMSGGVWLIPRKITFSNYQVILSDKMLWYSFRNTILKTVIGTVTSLFFTSTVAYAISRKNLKFKRIIKVLNLFTMFFGGGLIPYFVLINYLGLFDNFLVYIIPSLYSVYNMIIICSFFSSISDELHESAIVEGANEFQIFIRIYLPLSKPVLATVALWSAVGHWNSYFTTMIYTNGQENLITLQYYLMGVINKASYTASEALDPSVLEQVTSQTVSFAAIIVATLPILFVYPFLQKYFTKGIQLGATKG